MRRFRVISIIVVALFFTVNQVGFAATIGKIRVGDQLKSYILDDSLKIGDMTIKRGMSKPKVVEIAKRNGIKITKKTQDRWLCGPFELVFENGQLSQLPGMDFSYMFGRK